MMGSDLPYFDLGGETDYCRSISSSFQVIRAEARLKDPREWRVGAKSREQATARVRKRRGTLLAAVLLCDADPAEW